MSNEVIKHADLTMMYAILECLRGIKREMDARGLTFDEFLQYYEKAVEQIEKLKNEK